MTAVKNKQDVEFVDDFGSESDSQLARALRKNNKPLLLKEIMNDEPSSRSSEEFI